MDEGITLGEFEILEQIGQGGMGAVYRARQTALRRFVAIKTLQPALASDAEYVARFHNEAVAAAGLNHPNLVQVYSAGIADGLHYFAMEYVEGESAQDRLKRKGRIHPAEAIAIAMNVATALDYGWRKAQLIHRDIKPDNIFLSGDGEVKLGDLGLAKSLSQSQSLTMTGASMGTPHYISPEQAEGKKDIDLRTDIYSLGCTLYHLLSGQPPYGGDSAVAVMMKHVSAPVPDLRSVWPECPPALAATVAKAMQKSPAARQQTYGEWSAELRRAYDALDAPIPSAKKPKKPLLLIGVAVAAAVAIAALLHFAPWKKSAPPETATPLVTLEPGAIRLWDSPEKAKGDGAEWEDGAVRLDKHSLWNKLTASRDVALSAQIRMNSDAVSPQIWLRKKGQMQHGDEMFYSLGIAHGGKTVQLDTVVDGRRQTLKEWPLSRAYGSDEWVRVELRVVGDELTASAEGHVLGTLHDTSQPQSGGANLYATAKGYFRDIVYIPLDKTGVSDKPATRSANDPQPAEWLDASRDATLAKGNSMMRPSGNGWTITGQGRSFFAGGSQRDGAVRMRASFAEKNNISLIARWNEQPQNYYTAFVLATGDDVGLNCYRDGKLFKTLNSGGHTLPKPIRTGEEYELELRVVGDRSTVKLQGTVMIEVRDATYATGAFGIASALPSGDQRLVRTVEYLDLGGPAPAVSATAPHTTPAAVAYRLSPSTEPWVDAVSQPDLLKVAVKEGPALRMTAASLGHNIDLTPELKDGAVRMLFSGAGARIGSCSVNVRRTETTSYHFHMETNYLHVGIGIFDSAGNRTIKGDRLPAEAQRPEDAPVELELRVTGTTLIAKANGFEAARIEDSTLRQGHLDIRLEPGVLLHAVQTLDLSKPSTPPAARNPTPSAARMKDL